MSVLTHDNIVARMSSGPLDGRLVITPLLDEHQIGDGSVDVRLGNEFLLLTRYATESQTYRKWEDNGPAIYKSSRREFTDPLFLHPGQLVLGATFEFVALPRNLACYVIGRSSLGRTGLVIATATAVAPGYRGCITLEIANIGEVPLRLYSGMRIAQLVLHETSGTAEYRGRFTCATGPLPPLLSRDHEMSVWAPRDAKPVGFLDSKTPPSERDPSVSGQH